MLKSSKIHIEKTIKILADSGFQGIHKIHAHSEIPHKKTKKKKLTKEQKEENRK
jgi:hypothetical protein